MHARTSSQSPPSAMRRGMNARSASKSAPAGFTFAPARRVASRCAAIHRPIATPPNMSERRSTRSSHRPNPARSGCTAIRTTPSLSTDIANRDNHAIGHRVIRQPFRFSAARGRNVDINVAIVRGAVRDLRPVHGAATRKDFQMVMQVLQKWTETDILPF
jgi:hypothetical protein